MNPEFQAKMENVLACLAFVYAEVGYCQGMSFIVGEILNVVDDEELAFWLFTGLAEKHHLKMLFMHVIKSKHKYIGIACCSNAYAYSFCPT